MVSDKVQTLIMVLQGIRYLESNQRYLPEGVGEWIDAAITHINTGQYLKTDPYKWDPIFCKRHGVINGLKGMINETIAMIAMARLYPDYIITAALGDEQLDSLGIDFIIDYQNGTKVKCQVKSSTFRGSAGSCKLILQRDWYTNPLRLLYMRNVDRFIVVDSTPDSMQLFMCDYRSSANNYDASKESNPNDDIVELDLIKYCSFKRDKHRGLFNISNIIY
jgi:hypothetical protein